MPFFRLVISLMLILTLSACNTLKPTQEHVARETIQDPFQDINRKVFKFNMVADKYVLRPIAKTYVKVIPKPAQNGIGNFFSNLGEPFNAANNLLQGKYHRALVSTYRFVVNSTVGILGLVDVASYYDVKEANEGIGQTLAGWGVKPGPYIMMPFLGSTTLRDGLSNIAERMIFYPINEISDSSSTRTALLITDIVDIRSEFLGPDELLDGQLDPYAFFKSIYQKQHLDLLYDGSPPEAEPEDYDF